MVPYILYTDLPQTMDVQWKLYHHHMQDRYLDNSNTKKIPFHNLKKGDELSSLKWITTKLTEWLITEWLTDWEYDDWLIDCRAVNQLTDWLTDWLNDWLTD